MNLLAGHLGGRREMVIPTSVAAERNVLLEDEHILLPRVLCCSEISECCLL